MPISRYSKWASIFSKVSQESFDNIFKCESGKHPTLIKSYLAKRISLETMGILQSLVNYMKQFDGDLKQDLIWPDIRRMVTKYSSFLCFDKQKCKMKLLQLLKEI